MIDMSKENLVKVNKMYNQAGEIEYEFVEGSLIITFYDQEGNEEDSTVLTEEEFQLVMNDYYIDLLKEKGGNNNGN